MHPRNAPRLLHLLCALAITAGVHGCDPRTEHTTPDDRRPHQAATTPAPALPDFATIAERNVTALVSITTNYKPRARQPQLNNDRASVERGFGTGVVVSSDGKILTNDHVLATASDADITVELWDGSRHRVRTIYRDERYDLALLRIDPPLSKMATVTLDAAPPRPGEWVMAMGHPRALGNTVTVGVVSGLGRNHREIGAPTDLQPGGVWHFLQTDVSINPGSSGGPLFNVRGNVVGLNTAVLRGNQGEFEGIAFAIPSALLRHFLEEVATHGRVRHPSLGMVVAGVRVKSIDPGSPAARASLLPGDVIRAVAGVPVRRYHDLLYEIEIAGMDAPIPLSVAREDHPAITVEIVPEERA